MNQGFRFALRALITVALLATVFWQIEPAALATQFDNLRYSWLATALALTVPQVVISAWRWRLTAGCVGLRLSMKTAIREYYLATFLNQVLPAGVLGDAHRAWRHARRDHDSAAAWHAVFIERFSGQLSLALITLIALWQTPALIDGMRRSLTAMPISPMQSALLIAALLLLLAAGRRWAGRSPNLFAPIVRLGSNLRRSLLAPGVWPAQFVSSLLVVAGYIGVFLLCARAIDTGTPTAELLWLVPPVLMAMALPLSIAGWGLREGAAAVVWTLAGLPAQQGVALSLCYGVLVLVSSLPGALVLAFCAREPHQRPDMAE
ncbi:hypothetical protein S4A8_11371 [Salinisphaera sp. S4-8]|uniref:lysylphosphatidylglycerol synthase transmembrane domain-containing protein n=1 Tax=Salinisphaera sp. S4-8 TaxID=633357 RepID=UPI003340A9BD